MEIIFSKISKIRKQKLNKVEGELIYIQQEIRRLESEIQSAYLSIKELVIPKHGEVSILGFYQERRRVLNVEKKVLTKKLKTKNIELSKKQIEYKNAQMDFEKIKYLEEQELMKKIKKINKIEQKDLDDIANILQFRGQKI